MKQKAFAERFLKHLDKIDPGEVENFILRTVRERDFITRIFDALLAGIVVLDGDYQLSLVNTAARRILHWPQRRRVEGSYLPDLLDPGPLRELLQSFIDEPRPIKNEELHLRPGDERIYSVYLIPVWAPDNQDSMEAVALILQDLTAARERQLRHAQADKLASLATLTSGVAHEIKNPLNSLNIHGQLLERALNQFQDECGERLQGKGAERMQQSCQAIREEIERLKQCVDDFINAARPTRPVLSIHNVNQVLERVAAMARPELEARGIRLEFQPDSDLSPAMLDENQFLSALRNLIRNAVEAIEAAGRETGEGRITLRSRMVDERIEIQLSDNGCGIRPEDQPRIFEPYFTTKFNGSGLGLMAINRIVREHGGEIRVDSTEDVGTTFTIELPVPSRQVKLLSE